MFNKLKNFLTSSPVQFNGKPISLWKLLLLILIISFTSLIFLTIPRLNRPPNPDEVAQKTYEKARENAQVLSEKIAKQTEVPTDETPNVATITDVNLLQDQEFFKVAKNGDKLLIYEKAKIVVLYRPSEDKIIATAPVLYNQPTPAIAGSSSAQTATPSAN